MSDISFKQKLILVKQTTEMLATISSSVTRSSSAKLYTFFNYCYLHKILQRFPFNITSLAQWICLLLTVINCRGTS